METWLVEILVLPFVVAVALVVLIPVMLFITFVSKDDYRCGLRLPWEKP